MPESDCVYLNHAGTSWPKPAPVVAAVAAAMNSGPDEWAAEFEAAHREIARFFHIPEASQLLLTPGCTSSLSVAIADLPWQSGDRVLTSGLEHHAVAGPLARLAGQGVQVETLRRTPDIPIDLEQLETTLRQAPVRLVVLTAASNVTGELLPLADAIALARNHGAVTLIDAAQIVGWWDLDIPALGAHMVAFGAHKGLQAPWGIGGLYIAPDLPMNSLAAVCELPRDGQARTCTNQPSWCDVGSVDRIALAGLRAAVAWLKSPDQADRLDRARQLVERLAEGLETLGGVTQYGPADINDRMPVLACRFDRYSPRQVTDALAERGVIAAGGLQCAPRAHETLGTAPDGVVRWSPGPQQTAEQIDRALAAVNSLPR